MKFQHISTFNGSPAEVYAMLTDPGWRRKVGDAQGVVSSDITITPQGDGAKVVVDQIQNTAGLPAIAKKIAGETTHAILTEVWSSPSGGTVEILAPGKPTKAIGTTKLVADGSGTRHVTDLEVTVKVPLIAGKLEAMMADNIGKGMQVEEVVGNAWLGGDR